MKLAVINSTGPMGSSVVAALIEKFGYLNLPIRDLGMNRYLITKRNSDKEKFVDNFIRLIDYDSLFLKVGGVNVQDRDKSPPYQRVDKELVSGDLKNIQNKQFHELAELYDELRAIYKTALKYKHCKPDPEKHIEITTDFYMNQPKKLIDSYIAEFRNVIFIHLHRNFLGWVESIASQRFSSPAKRHRFFLHELHRRYYDYETKIKNCNGLHINFESLFLPHTWTLIDRLAEALNEPIPDIQWENELYDLYGNLRDFNKAFTLADVDGRYLSKITQRLIKIFAQKKKTTYLHDPAVYLFYLFDLIRFHAKKMP